MKALGVIPARYPSTRLPGKPLVSNLQVNPVEGFLIWTVFPYEPEAPTGSTIQ